MATPEVTLAPFRRADCGTLAEWLADPVRLAMTAPDWRHPMTADDIERAYFGRAYGAELFRVMSGERMVGHAGMRIVQEVTGHLFHVIVDPALHGQGYGRAMMDALARRAFQELNLHRMALFVFDSNVPAVALYLSTGFRVEGHHPESFRCEERWLSTYSMGLLRSDWQRSALKE